MSIVVSLIWQLSLARSVLSLLLSIVFLLLVGAIGSHYLFKQSRTRFEEESLNSFNLSAEKVANVLAAPSSNEKILALQDLTPELLKDSQAAFTGIGRLLFRFFAIGRLFAVLGVTISFAVFLATYQQVERLSEQNSLIQLQSLSSHQQISVSMRNEITNIRALISLASELRICLLYTSPSPRDATLSRMPSSA